MPDGSEGKGSPGGPEPDAKGSAEEEPKVVYDRWQAPDMRQSTTSGREIWEYATEDNRDSGCLVWALVLTILGILAGAAGVLFLLYRLAD
jgi:hypothetical protein